PRRGRARLPAGGRRDGDGHGQAGEPGRGRVGHRVRHRSGDLRDADRLGRVLQRRPVTGPDDRGLAVPVVVAVPDRSHRGRGAGRPLLRPGGAPRRPARGGAALAGGDAAVGGGGGAAVVRQAAVPVTAAVVRQAAVVR